MTYRLSDFKAGQRIEFHPATDLWMRGARYGEVQKVGRALVQVKLDISGPWHGSFVLVKPGDIGEIVS